MHVLYQVHEVARAVREGELHVLLFRFLYLKFLTINQTYFWKFFLLKVSYSDFNLFSLNIYFKVYHYSIGIIYYCGATNAVVLLRGDHFML